MDQKWVRLAVSGFGIALCLFGGFRYYSGVQGFQAAVAERNAQIQELEAEVSDVEEEARVQEEAGTDGEGLLLDARDAGEAVAALENEYTRMLAKERSTDEAQVAFEVRQADIWETMDRYFGEGSFLRTQWFAVDGKTSEESSWVFLSNYAFSGTQVPVLWQYVSEKDGILAYVSGTYDGSTGMFSGLSKAVTAVGNTKIPMTESGAGPSVDADTSGIFEIMDQVGGGDTPTEYTEEQIRNMERANEDRLRAMEEMKEQQNGGNSR